jgi:hypothetical protein
MKYCPTCQQRYSRGQRFCRTDGTLLILDPYRQDVQDFDTLPTLEMPEDPLNQLQDPTVDLQSDDLRDSDKERVSDLEPFGEADCESELKVMGSSEYSKYYFDHTRFNREP